uniref:Integrase catalytic domain-containing protein n=1 Tax=Trichuris muris TaxID=70415 RepID=A0A5S6Q439_TRIMR
MEAEATAELLMCRFFAKFGPPDSVHSDQGRTFEASLMKELWQLFGIQKTRTTPYHQQSNGLVERVNSTLLDVLQALASEAFETWDRILPMVTMAYNTSVHEATGTTPYFAMFGREARLPVESVESPLTVESPNRRRRTSATISGKSENNFMRCTVSCDET